MDREKTNQNQPPQPAQTQPTLPMPEEYFLAWKQGGEAKLKEMLESVRRANALREEQDSPGLLEEKRTATKRSTP